MSIFILSNMINKRNKNHCLEKRIKFMNAYKVQRKYFYL